MVDKHCGDPVAKSLKMSSALDQLKQYTTVVADTGDFEGDGIWDYPSVLKIWLYAELSCTICQFWLVRLVTVVHITQVVVLRTVLNITHFDVFRYLEDVLRIQAGPSCV